MAITNPEFLEIEDNLDMIGESTFSALPNFETFSEMNYTLGNLSKPQLVLTSNDIYQRILQDFKRTRHPSNTHDKSRNISTTNTSILVDNPLPEAIFKPNTNPFGKVTELSSVSDKIRKLIGIDVHLVACPKEELHVFLFSVTVALYPELLSYQLPERLRCFKRIRSRMAFDLDDRGLFVKYGYRGSFRKTVAQDELFGDKPIYSYWFRKYLSDYFNVNILVLFHDMVITFSPIKYRTSLIYYYQDGGLQILSHSNGKCFFDYDIITKITESNKLILEHIHPVSKYKLKELQQIAVSLDLPITCKSSGSNIRNIVKSTLYLDISNRLSWLN